MHLGKRCQLNNRGIEGDDHSFCPGICWRVRLDKTLVDLGDAAQRLEHPFCAPMASTSKAELRHLHLPRRWEVVVSVLAIDVTGSIRSSRVIDVLPS